MEKNLSTWFEEQFEKHLKDANSRNEAFLKTIDDIGFTPYTSYRSFSVVRKRNKKLKNKLPR